ncbi:hypothetical protein CsSME_00046125 [Camellia sinensis var. sinensis]
MTMETKLMHLCFVGSFDDLTLLVFRLWWCW